MEIAVFTTVNRWDARQKPPGTLVFRLLTTQGAQKTLGLLEDPTASPTVIVHQVDVRNGVDRIGDGIAWALLENLVTVQMEPQ